MSSIDNRIVKMIFDNSQFESNAKTSINTLSQLKKSLDLGRVASDLNAATQTLNNANLGSIGSTLENLNSKFSAFGIVGQTVISSLTQAAMDFGAKMTANVIEPIVSGGSRRAFAIENARFTLQGLISDVGEVERIMEDAKNSVDGTAYAYNDAASAAAQFAASGLKSGEQMQSVLAAIAGTAATVNADYGDISHIFTTIAGNGRLMTEQLNQFSYRGMNAAATLTDAFNDVLHGSSTLSEGMQDNIRSMVEVGMAEINDFSGSLEGITESDLRALVSKGKIDFETFSAIMSMTFGEHAKDANKTFSGSMSNIQAALARTGAMFYTELIAQEGPLVKLFNSVRNAINEFNKVLDPMVYIWNEFVISFADGLRTMIDTFIDKGGFGIIGESLWEVGHIIRQVARTIHEAMAGIGDVLDPMTNLKEEFLSSSEFKGSGWADALIDVLSKIRDFLKSLSTNMEFWNTFYKIARSLVNVFAGLKNIVTIVFDVISALFGAFKDVGSSGKLADVVLSLTDGFRKFTEAIRPTGEQLEKLRNFFRGIFEIVRAVASVVFGALKTAFEAISKLFGATNTNGDILYDVLSKIGDVLQTVAGAIRFFAESAKSAMSVLKQFADSLGITDAVQKFLAFLDVRRRLDDFSKSMSSLKDRLVEFGTAFGAGNAIKALSDGFHALTDAISGFRDNVDTSGLMADLKDRMSSVKDGIQGLLTIIGGKLGPYLEAFKEQVREAIEAVKKFVSEIRNGDIDVKDTVIGKLKSAFEKIKGVADSVLPGIKAAFDEIKKSIGEFFSSMKSNAENNGSGIRLIDILGVGGTIAGIKVVIDKIKGLFSKDEDSTGITSFLKELKDSVVDTFGEIQNTLKAGTLVAIAVAIGILAGSLYLIARIDNERILGALVTVAALTKILQKLTESLRETSASAGSMMKTAFTMVVVSGAVYILAKAMAQLGELDPQQLWRSLFVVAMVAAGFTAIAKVLSKSGGEMVKGLGGLIFMAGAIALMTVPIKQLGEMNPEDMEKGMQAVVVLMSMMSLLMAAARGSNFGASAGLGLVLMASSIRVVLISVKEIVSMAETMDPGKLNQAMLAVEAIIGSMAAIMLVSKGSNFGASAGLGLVLMAASIRVVLISVKEIVNMAKDMDPNQLNQAMLGITAIMGLMMAMMAVSKGSSFGASSGVGLLLMAVAIKMLIEPIERLSQLGLFEIAKAIIALAGALLIMVFAVNMLGADDAPGVLALLGLSAALVILAYGLTLISAIPFPVLLGSLLGLALAIGGFALAASLLTPVLVPMMILAGVLLAMGVAMLAAAVAVAVFVATVPLLAGAFLAFLETITTMADPICKALIDFINEMANVIRNNYDAFYDAMGNLLSAIWEALSELVGRISSFIAENLPGWIAHAGQVANDIMNGFIDFVMSGIDGIIEAGKNFARGFLDGIAGIPGEISAAASDFASQALNAVSSFLGIASPSKKARVIGEYFALGFANGVSDSAGMAAESTRYMAMAAMAAFDEAIDDGYEPTITPVIDTTNIQNGIGEMNSMFDTMPSTYDVGGVIDANKQLSIDAMEGMGSESDYTSILGEMAGLREDMSKYNDMMSKLQIVMDTGTLVGKLSPGIDRQLGRNAMLAGRGVV